MLAHDNVIGQSTYFISLPVKVSFSYSSCINVVYLKPIKFYTIQRQAVIYAI